jgi:4-hydroxy-tetrahydrodipicolinate reductase
MKKPVTGKPRLALYGIGQFGKYFAKLAVQAGLPIVAAYNRAGAKVGKELGHLAGLDRDLGIIVQDGDKADLSKLEADVLIISVGNHIRTLFPIYQRFLNAGVNILCLAGEACYPYGIDVKLAEEIDTLAKKNNVSFTGGGIWDVSRIWPGILAAGPCTELKSLYHRSITDVSRQIISKEQAWECGIGHTVQEFWDKGYGKNPMALLYVTIPEHVFHALGYTWTNPRVTLEPVVFDIPVKLHLFEDPIKAGTTVGTRIICDVDTKEGPTARAEIELRMFKEGEVEHMYWAVKGRPEINIRVERNDSMHATAACLFNRIPDVIKAPPGIALISRMGPVRPTALGVRI